MFSVIIPLYNKSAYIEKCLHSVFEQTFQDFEVIVVNDGSTDDGVEKVQRIIAEGLRSLVSPISANWLPGEHRSQRTKYSRSSEIETKEIQNPEALAPCNCKITLINQENFGVSVARNNGVKSAKYENIAFLDADDWWESSYLEEMKNLIEEFPLAGIYGSSYFLVKNGQKRVAKIGVDHDFEKGIIDYCQIYANTLCMPIWTGAIVVPKKIFEIEKGFNPNLKLGEDFDLWVRIAFNHPVILLNKQLAYYNQDVEMAGRAVGNKLYEPSEHMIFQDYSSLQLNSDFSILFEKMALYNLFPYYLANKNSTELTRIISSIHWEKHSLKYRLYYQLIPKPIVKLWIQFLKIGSMLKNKLTSAYEADHN